MKDLFIADAHLREPDAPAYRHLLEFLSSQRGQIRHLVLLGDIFEFWVGYRHCVFTAYLPLLQLLQQLQADGTKIIMVEGNHDFHMGPFFSESLQATILPDGGRIELDNQQLYLCHGDTLAATPNYLRLRRFFRSAFARLLIRILPPDTTWNIADLLGKASKGRRKNRPQRSYRLPEQAILDAAARQFDLGCTSFMCGHFHQSWHQQNGQHQVLVVGNWGTTCHYAVLEHGQFRLEQYQP